MVKSGMLNTKKRKVGTILEISLLKSLKLQAVVENRPMADVISDAIEQYLGRRQEEDEPPSGFPKLLKHPMLKHPAMRASFNEVRTVLEKDTY